MMSHRLLIAVLGFMLFSSVSALSAEKSVIVGFKQKPGPSERALIRRAKGVIQRSYQLIPADMAAGPGRNVAQAYARFASAMQTGTADTPDFGDAVVRHALIDAMERSHKESKVIKLA